jgi:hypothetical protein
MAGVLPYGIDDADNPSHFARWITPTSWVAGFGADDVKRIMRDTLATFLGDG